MRRLGPLLGLTASLALLCSGCVTMPQPVKVDFAEPRPAPAAPAPVARAATGSLFQSVSYRPAFEDARARTVGDTITIQIVENVTASQVSKSTSNRTSSTDAKVSAAPLISAMDIANLKVGAASTNDFSGKGGTESANTFSGTITATVVEVLPNGHMVVTGEKQIGVNQNVDVLRFSGTIDPKAVQPGNVVSSNKVANARMESRGRGAQAEAQTVGLLTRFFFSFLPF
jgi:flagellar L-ring protein precursor FlgH